MVDVLKRINDLRIQRGWTIYKLAEEATIAHSTMSNMFARRTMPSIYTLNQICDAFGITMAEFFDDKGSADEETRLLYLFRSLDEKDKNTIIALSEVMHKNQR